MIDVSPVEYHHGAFEASQRSMESQTTSYRLTLEPKREYIWVMEAHLGVSEAHPRAVNAYSGYVETHTKVLEVYSGDSGLNLERGA